MASNSKLTWKHRVGYALGDLGGCMTYTLMGAFMTRYFVNVALIDTAIIAVMTLVWKIFDGLSNPIVGVMMDKSFARSKNPLGKFRPWILRVTPLMTVTAVLVFTAPNWVTGASRLVVAFSTYLFYELFYAIHSIALGGLLSAMAKDDDERTALSSARGIGGMVGNVVAQVLFPVIILYFESRPELGYGVGAVICAVLGFFTCLLYYVLTEERNTVQQAEQMQPAKSTDILEVFRKNRAFVALCAHGLLQGVMLSINSALSTYLYADVLGNLALMSLGSIAVVPVSLVIIGLVPVVSRKIGSLKVLNGSFLVGGGLFLFVFALHVLTDISIWLHMVLYTLACSLTSVGNMMQWGMVSEAIEYNEYLTGKRVEGSINGTFNMLRRLGQGLGGALAVALLGIVGYDPAVTLQSQTTVFGIQVLSLVLPGLCIFGSWAVFRFLWNITPQVKAEMARKKANV